MEISGIRQRPTKILNLNMNSDHGNNIERNARFEYLMDMLLERRATDAEKAELRKMVIDGYGDRFQDRFDDVINSDLGDGDMSPEKQQEILMNILDREPVATLETQNLASQKNTTSTWKWLAAAAAIGIFAIAAWYITAPNLKPEAENQALSEVQAKGPMIYAGKRFVKLDDGSTILMTDSSQLTVHEDFNTKTRTVSLIGKAYFDIAHNADKPFQIITHDVTTTVLGTAFSIDATNEKKVQVTVTRGRVQVGDQNHVYGLLTRNQQLTVNLETKQFEKTSTDAEKVTEWKRNYLVFDNVTMEVASAIIKEKYNVNVLYSNDAIKHCNFTVTFLDGENLEQVLEVVSTLAKVKYEILPDGNVKLTGEGCNPAP